MESIAATINYTFPFTVDSYSSAVEHLRNEGPILNLDTAENNINVHINATIQADSSNTAVWTAVINISPKPTQVPTTPKSIVPTAPFGSEIENKVYEDFNKLNSENTFEAFDISEKGKKS